MTAHIDIARANYAKPHRLGDQIVGVGTYRGTYSATGTDMQARVAHA